VSIDGRSALGFATHRRRSARARAPRCLRAISDQGLFAFRQAGGWFGIFSQPWGYAEVLAEPAGWAQFKQEEQTYLTAEEHRLLLEVPFCVGAVTPGGEVGLTSGVMDLVHRVDDYWNVIDYKTDRSGVSSTARYDAQLRAYREMWQKMTGCDVRTELISTRALPRRA